MNEIVVADTSCLIVLHEIGELDILHKVFDKVTITREVREEFETVLPLWINVVELTNIEKKTLLSLTLDDGEASSIAFCLEQDESSLLIIDERKGRKVARSLGISIVGTLGIILKAKQRGFISSVRSQIKKMEKTDFRMSRGLKEVVIAQAGEE
jgi:predicted nucleic acid-binding protein